MVYATFKGISELFNCITVTFIVSVETFKLRIKLGGLCEADPDPDP